MVKVYQTKTGNDGNCFAACLASILEVDIKSIPVMPENDTRGVKVYQNYLKPFNLGIMYVEPFGSNKKPFGYTIGSFNRIDKKNSHAVVCRNGIKVHDPFPEFEASVKLGKLLHWFVVIVLDPKKPILWT